MNRHTCGYGPRDPQIDNGITVSDLAHSEQVRGVHDVTLECIDVLIFCIERNGGNERIANANRRSCMRNLYSRCRCQGRTEKCKCDKYSIDHNQPVQRYAIMEKSTRFTLPS